ncbi:translation initiation factor IF-2 N-terminal domain-containing protein, partial [Mycolicibacterium wolinskyi]|uniref:translation initiation factor IF-2 N-terminal domain-containing protein n=1 Tax=Mycolicibacterium wolinskyi TaxID=59750 RepID=UPI0021F25993
MAGKARVHELAKELGVTSKELLATLKEQGEFVKSASSTVEAPVARRLRETFGTKSDSKAGKKADDKPRSQPAAGNGAAAAPKPSGPTPSTAARPGPPAKPAPAAAAPAPRRPRPPGRARRPSQHPRPPH